MVVAEVVDAVAVAAEEEEMVVAAEVAAEVELVRVVSD